MTDVIYRRMVEGDREGIHSLKVNAFLKDEILCQNLNTDIEKLGFVWIDGVFPRLVEDGISAVAEDTVTGELVGFMCFIVLTKGIPTKNVISNDNPVTRKYASVYEVMDFLVPEEGTYSKYGVERFASDRAMCVRKSHRKRGISTRLLMKSLELMKQKDIKLAAAECSSVYSLKSFLNAGFKEVSSLSYEEVVERWPEFTMTEAFKFHQRVVGVVKEM